MVMISYFSGFFSPLVGAIFDKIGYRGLSGNFKLTKFFIYLLYIFFFKKGVLGQIIIGLAYTLMICLPSEAYGYFLIGFI